MSQAFERTVGVIGGLALVGLNIAVVAFFVLWQIADTAAINHMESASGWDASRMPPNANLLWLAANASVFMVSVVDALAIFIVAILVKANRRAQAMAADHAGRTHSVR
ncbi:hypothetical protein [Agromyces sp. NPDC055658]